MPDLEEVVFQGLGEASMCWSETPKGVFDSENAKRIGDSVIQAIKEHEQQLYEDVKALHSALNEFLPLFILGNGTDYAGIDEAIEALARHPELPITVALEDYIVLQSQGVDILPVTMKVLDANGKELSRVNTFIGKREADS